MKPCLNLGSYNYLGFADDWNESCREDVLGALDDFFPASCGTRYETGVLHFDCAATHSHSVE